MVIWDELMSLSRTWRVASVLMPVEGLCLKQEYPFSVPNEQGPPQRQEKLWHFCNRVAHIQT